MANYSPTNYYRLPAEWYPQSGIQLTWPHADTDWKEYLHAITATFIEMAKVIVKYEKLLIVAKHVEEVKALLKAEVAPEYFRNIVFCSAANNDTWARDHAFITLISHNGTSATGDGNLLLDFGFNGWGNKFESRLDNALNRTVYYDGLLNGELVDHNDFILEGGSIESDGKGTIFTTSMCLLAPHRNQPMSKEAIEEKLKTVLHARRMVWIDHGNLVGDDTDGHIDTIVRACPADTLAYVGCDDPHDEQYQDFKLLEKQLQTLRTLDGKPYRLLKLPMPEPIYDGDDRLPATYANFVILNGAVLYPTYAQPANDEQARRVLQQAFPDRTLVGIDARTVIRQHGSLHCLTMQYPQTVISNMNERPSIF
ncbi:MAG TPA: agmatine deiminase family protein [Prevotella sp.]